MTDLPSELTPILDELGVDLCGLDVLFLGTPAPEFQDAANVHYLEDVKCVADLDSELRAHVGIVAGQLETMEHEDGVNLLARLRDVHCVKVLLLVSGGDWTRDELLVLGYHETKHLSSNRRCYLYDAEISNQPRDWNNPGNWANPENFRKYRW
jgi:hypothetical protein